jgi:predicted phosphodiesterase
MDSSAWRRVALVADIHGNLPALEAVLAEVRAAGVEALIVAGDVLPGPMPVECLDLLAAMPVPVSYLTGNGDREAIRSVDGLELTSVPPRFRPPVAWSGARLRGDQVALLRRWPATLEIEIEGVGRVLVCHATPRSDVEIFTRATPDATIAPAFVEVTAPIVVCGHTHMPFDRQIAGRRVINAGSVGMPFGPPGADWLLVDAAGPRHVHTGYDLESAAARVRATSYPGADAFAATSVLNPPAEEAMIAMFEGAPR